MSDLREVLIRAIESSGQLDPDLLTGKIDRFLPKFISGRIRSNGEPLDDYIKDIVEKLSSLNLDIHTIIAGAVWQTVVIQSDLQSAVESEFGGEISELVRRVCKISAIDYSAGEGEQAEQFCNLILALARDIRVLFLLLVDRTHVLAMLHRYPQKDAVKLAKESREIFAPLANRLGIGSLKLELDDLSFQILEPEIYFELKRKVEARSADRETYLQMVVQIIIEKMKEDGIDVQIKGRLKHFDSIYKKMLKQNIPFDEVYDLVGVRVIAADLKECYAVLGVIHSLWKPIPRRFKDYIAMPKQNMYQSIHTTVIGPSGYPLEVQIRSKEMDRIAECGIAAHWIYKDKSVDRKYEHKFAWLRQIMEWKKESRDPVEMMEILKVDLFPDEVYVFTPKGEVRTLPKGATVVDFAYLIHTTIGQHCKGARINNQIVPLKTELSNGDIIEIVTSASARPSMDWLAFVRTSSARSKIKRFLREQQKESAIQTGRENLTRMLKKNRLLMEGILESKVFDHVVSKMGYKSADDLFAALGFGEVSEIQVLNRFETEQTAKVASRASIKTLPTVNTKKVTIGQSTDMMMRFARCCEPIPGESIVGYITYGRGITIHSVRCVNLTKLEKERLIKAEWEKDDRPSYPVRIGFKGFYRPELMSEISSILEKSNSKLVTHKIETVENMKMRGEIQVAIYEFSKIEHIMNAMQKIQGIKQVNRMKSRKK